MKRDKKIAFFEQMVKAGKLSQQDMIEYKSGQKQLITDEVYLRKQLNGLSGVQEFVNENDVQKNCITNLSKGRVPDEKNLIIDLVGLRYGWAATAVDPALVSYSNAIYSISDTEFDAGATATGGEVYARQIPVALQNAIYEIKCDNAVVDQGRVYELLTYNVSNDAVNGHEKNYRELEWPKLLLSGKRLTCDIKFPEVAGPAVAGFHYLELTVKGLGLGKRS